MDRPLLLSVAFIRLTLFCMIVLQVQGALAEPWVGYRRGGGEVSVDPRTNRAMIQRGGVESQLWDGVHVLDDGSTITVRSGQVVPNREILDSRREPDMPEVIRRPHADMWTGPPITGRSPCELLVERVCGSGSACAESEACSMSRQLLDFENEERAASRMHNRMTRASGECLEVELDRVYFMTCAPAGPKPARDPAKAGGVSR